VGWANSWFLSVAHALLLCFALPDAQSQWVLSCYHQIGLLSQLSLIFEYNILYSLFKDLSIEKVIFLLTLYTFNKAEIHYRSRLELATSPVGVLP
jgi:hypothetical protein